MTINKVVILALGLSLTAASCNLFGGGGVRGVLKSEDGGKNFQSSNALTPKGDIGKVSARILTADAKNPDIMYLGASNGVYKTEDAGKTWRHILTGISVLDIASDPSISDLIYAVGLAGQNGKIIKSPDGGNSWADIFTEPSKSNAVTTLSVSKANSRILLAGLATGEIIRSSDEGLTWQVITDLQDQILKIRVYNSFTAYALSLTKGLYKSTDQGSNWTPLPINKPRTGFSTGITVGGNNNTSATPTIPTPKRFLDMGFDQKLAGVIFLASQDGLLRTIDDGNTWSVMYLPVRDTSLRVTAVSVNPNDSNSIFIAVGSTLFKTTNGGVTWETNKLPTSQAVKQIVINPITPNVIYLGLGEIN